MLVFPGLVFSMFCLRLLWASLLRTWRSALIWSLFFFCFCFRFIVLQHCACSCLFSWALHFGCIYSISGIHVCSYFLCCCTDWVFCSSWSLKLISLSVYILCMLQLWRVEWVSYSSWSCCKCQPYCAFFCHVPVVNSVCDVPVLVQQLNPYLTTDMLFRLVVP